MSELVCEHKLAALILQNVISWNSLLKEIMGKYSMSIFKEFRLLIQMIFLVTKFGEQ